MSVLKYQSDDELIRVMDEWVRNFFPPNVVKNERNVTLIGDRCIQKYGLVSISGLTEAAHELGAANLELIPTPPQPKELTQEEKAAIFQAKELKRIQKEQLENSIPFEERAAVAKEKVRKEAEKEAKRQADSKDALNSEIMSYECYRGPNARDWSAIEMVIADLKRVAVRTNGKVDFVRTLALVRQVKSELPDVPKLGDVDKTRSRIIQRQEDAKIPVDKKTQEVNSWANRPR